MSDILELRQRITQEKEALVQRLKRWRKLNGLSVRQTVAMMQSLGFPVISRRTVEAWENGARAPGQVVLLALDQFLEKHPTVTDVPKFGRWQLSDEKKAEIRALRKQGMTLLSLAQRFKISESGISRICSEKPRPSGRCRTKTHHAIQAKATTPDKEPKPAPKIWNFPR